MSKRMSVKTEKISFVTQGVVVIAICVMVAKAMINDFSIQGILAGIAQAMELKEFWHIVVIPLLISPFYFVAAFLRQSDQQFTIVCSLYIVSLVCAIYITIMGMPIMGIYLLVTTLWCFVNAYRSIHS